MKGYGYTIDLPVQVPTFKFTRESGAEVYVYAKKFRGEAGSVSVPDTVEITLVRDALGHAVELSEEEWAAAQREAERLLA